MKAVRFFVNKLALIYSDIRNFWTDRDWKASVVFLQSDYPRGLPLLFLSERRMERRRPTRRLDVLVRELEVREGRLRESAGTQEEEPGSTLARERHEVQLLKRRIRRLERRTQNLDGRP